MTLYKKVPLFISEPIHKEVVAIDLELVLIVMEE